MLCSTAPLHWGDLHASPRVCCCHPHVMARGHTAEEGRHWDPRASLHPPSRLHQARPRRGPVCWASARVTTGRGSALLPSLLGHECLPPPPPASPPCARTRVRQAEIHCVSHRHHCPSRLPVTMATLQGSCCHVSSEPESRNVGRKIHMAAVMSWSLRESTPSGLVVERGPLLPRWAPFL